MHAANPEPSLTISYQQKNFVQSVKDFAGSLQLPFQDNGFRFCPTMANGTYRAIPFEEGFSAALSDYTINKEFVVSRVPDEEFGVLIYLYRFNTKGPIAYKVNDSERLAHNNVYHALRVINTQTSQVISIPPDTTVKGLAIHLEKRWIENNLGHDVLKVMDYLQKVNYFKEFMNAKQQKLFNEIFEVAPGHPYPNVFIKSRILRLLDKLFENFLQRDISEAPEKLSETDFEVLQKIEFMLIENYDQVFPSIEKLARAALMSESKLKKLFKEAFGMGMYEYYQKNRMHKAKELILSGKHSVTEVGLKLGYQNLSNFSAAFRKEFQHLPSEIIP